MISRKKPATNRRRSSARRSQNLLEVKIRSRMANSQRNRRILVWSCKVIFFALLVSGAIYGGREGLRHFFWENPEYNLAVVEINNDGPALTREMVLAATQLQVGENIFGISLAKAQAALAELPQVERVELRRVLPNKITIEMTERRPVAWLADIGVPDPVTAETSFLIDAKGSLFKPKRQLPEYFRLPVIYGVQPENFLSGEVVQVAEVRSALDLIRINGETGRVLIQNIDLSNGYCMVITNGRGAKISFPLDDIDRHLDRLTAVLDGVARSHNGMEVQTVNLMVERNIPVTFVGTTPSEPEAVAPVAEKAPEGSASSAPSATVRKASAVSSSTKAKTKTTSSSTTKKKSSSSTASSRSR